MHQSYSLQELASKIGAMVEGDPNKRISGLADIQHATESEIAFYANPRYHQQMLSSKAGAVILTPTTDRPRDRSYLLHNAPSEAFQQLISLFKVDVPRLSGFSGIHSTAVIHPSATIGKNVTICPYAVIDEEVHVGEGSFIGSFSYIGPHSRIGVNVLIHPSVVVREGSCLGNNVIIQPGAVIGSCGYGYITDQEGNHKKLEQLGNVVINDNVEIGANTTIDRARFQSTVVGEGTKIDNLVQVAHNVEIGKRALIVAQVAIAGSTKIGSYVVLGGRSAVNGHISICDHTQIAAFSGVSKSIYKSGVYAGVPAAPIAESNRRDVLLRRIETVFERLDALEKANDGSN